LALAAQQVIKGERIFWVDATRMRIGFQGSLYKLDGNYSLVTFTDAPFGACGSGHDFAMGALAVMGSRLAPEKRIRKALEAAARFDLYTAAPFQIVSK